MWEAYPLQMPLFTELRKVVKYFKQFGLAKAIETKWRNKMEETSGLLATYYLLLHN